MKLICGAGRGPLAGSVYAAVILPEQHPIVGLNDSKKLTARQRERLFVEIQHALAWVRGDASVAEIDSINILQATMLAMRRAIETLDPAAEEALIDGNRVLRGF